MTRSIVEWSRLAHELAREKGEHSVACETCAPVDPEYPRAWCYKCFATRRVEVDHKSPTRIASRLALIHLAISRAVECVVKGEMALEWEGYAMDQPTGFPIALADVFIRLCDLAESLNIVLADFGGGFPASQAFVQEDLLAAFSELHGVVSQCDDHRLPGGPKSTNDLNSVSYELQGLASACGIDLFAAAELKYAYEKGRAK